MMHGLNYRGRGQNPGRIYAYIMLVWIVACAMGCAGPVKIVHNGSWHPAEYRYGRMRPAGAVPDIRNHVIAVDGRGCAARPHSRKGSAL